MFSDPRIGTAAASGVALALVFLAVHTFTFFSGVEVSADFQSALLTIVVAVGGMFVHPAKDDLAALHKLILARLGEKGVVTAVPSPGGVVLSTTPPLSAAEMLRAAEGKQ